MEVSERVARAHLVLMFAPQSGCWAGSCERRYQDMWTCKRRFATYGLDKRERRT